MDITAYDLTDGYGSQMFMDRCMDIVGVHSHEALMTFDEAWRIGYEGGATEVLLAFWDLCEMNGLG